VSRGRRYLEEIYALDNPEDVRAFYDRTAGDYEEILLHDAGYVSPVVCARLFARFFPHRDAVVVDLGCGTGLLGAELAKLGYARIDGIDFSPEMLAVAAQRGCYARLAVGDLNRGLDLPTESYAAAASAGVLGQHVGPGAIDEALRIVERGGVVCFSVNERAFESHGFRDKIESLVAEEGVECLLLSKEEYHVNEGIEGWVCLLRKR